MTFTVYTGGPIDYAPAGSDVTKDGHNWRHLIGLQTNGQIVVYCPICEAKSQYGITPTDQAIFMRNYHAMVKSDLAVFDLSGGFTIGTPIEVEYRHTLRPADGMATTAIVHPQDPGLFVRRWVKAGATILESLDGVGPWLLKQSILVPV